MATNPKSSQIAFADRSEWPPVEQLQPDDSVEVTVVPGVPVVPAVPPVPLGAPAAPATPPVPLVPPELVAPEAPPVPLPCALGCHAASVRASLLASGSVIRGRV